MSDIEFIAKRIDTMDNKIDKNKDIVDGAINKLTEQVTILVMELKGFPRYNQPCEFFKTHLSEHKDWRRTLTQWVGGIVGGLVLMYVGYKLGIK